MVSFFSQKVKEKVVLIRELSRKCSTEAHGRRGTPRHSGLPTPESFRLKNGVRLRSVTKTRLGDMKLSNLLLIFLIFPLEAYRSVQSMAEAELKAGVVNFSRRTDSGCRMLLRLHRSLLWLKLMLEGLAEGPDPDGRYKTPEELSR